MKDLNSFATAIEKALEEALIIQRETPDEKIVFNIRAKLYELAMQLAPEARREDIDTMKEWIDPQPGEVSIDLSAGTGFLTKHLAEWTNNTVYAVDPSKEQLMILFRNIPSLHIKPIVNSLAQETTEDRVGILECIPEQVDFITSFGGMHHVYYQEKMMEHAEKLLKPGGRFVAADVADNSPLAHHFDNVVACKCITGHTARWLSEERLRKLIVPLPTLTLNRCMMRIQQWQFSSRRQMALFFKGLHAYNMPEEEVLQDLSDQLGFIEENNRVILDWPMLFFDVRKTP